MTWVLIVSRRHAASVAAVEEALAVVEPFLATAAPSAD
jgi:hypothetical protein